MALSATRDGTETVGTLVTDALIKLHVLVGGETASTEDSAVGISNLRRMLRTWAARGIRLWLNEQQTVTLAADTATYTLDPRTLEVFEPGAYLRSGTTDTPVRVISREEYNRLPNKTASGDPFLVFIDRTRTSTTATVYPVPSAVGDTISLPTKRQIFDVTALSEEMEVPPEWSETILYNLAVRMAPDFEAIPRPDVVNMATELYGILEGQDRETSTFMRARRR